MFRLNLYPEARQKRHARRAKITSTFVTVVLSGLILLATFFHAVTGGLLSERTQSLRAQTAQWQSKTAALKAGARAADVGALEARLVNRAGRVVWAPKLAELAREIRGPILIDRISVGRPERGGQINPEFFLQGRIMHRAGVRPTEEAMQYIDALKANPVMSQGLVGLEIASIREEEQVTEETVTRETVFRITSLYEEAPSP